MTKDIMLVQIVSNFGSRKDAGPKAQCDVATILRRLGAKDVIVNRRFFLNRLMRFLCGFLWLLKTRWLRWILPNAGVVFVQYPSPAHSSFEALSVLSKKVKEKRSLRIISLVHDIATLRWGCGPMDARSLSCEEKKMFDLSDRIIAHNERMALILQAKGVPSEKIVCLGIFDYLTDSRPPEKCELNSEIAIAGCLNADKVGYLQDLKRIVGCQWRLYGNGEKLDSIVAENVKYMGSHSPDELPSKIKASFGLVWDGPDSTTCNGNFGEYLKINNPHKLSLYLATGIPVIIWKKAALASFVSRNHLGMLVDSLWDIPEMIQELTQEGYADLRRNVLCVSMKIRSGEFTTNAVIKCLEEITIGCSNE